jgi:UDP-2,3-diacylglucosamine pyrophosphatase LpxH
MDIDSSILIVSDLHLGSRMARAKDLAAFLARTDFGTLILNGDILDNPNLRFLSPDHWQLLTRLREIALSGKRVIWVAGNHDFFAKQFFKSLGIETHTHFSFTWSGKRCVVLHGHQYDKFLIQSEPLATTLNRSYRLIQRFDGQKKRMSGFVKKRYKVWLRVSKRVAKGALEYASGKGMDYVFCGHTHDCLTMKAGKATYLNSGCWVDDKCSYILLKDGEVRMESVLVGKPQAVKV